MNQKQDYDNSALYLMRILSLCFFIFICMLAAVAFSDYKETKRIENLPPDEYASYLLEQEKLQLVEKEKEENRKQEEEQFLKEMSVFSKNGITLNSIAGLHSAEFLIEDIGTEKKLVLGTDLPIGKSLDIYTENRGELYTKWQNERTGSYLFGTVWQHNTNFSVPDTKEGDFIFLKYQDAVSVTVYFN